ncbi:phosphohydrolase [Mycobacteroides abscessus]|uniref:phosphohydrolase n=1 Tax=Mycobacteroides abscessus TaxID=36809 RepID=UPI000C2670D7|nr:phosphohydrolase [Mycobacteroides abscessus]
MTHYGSTLRSAHSGQCDKLGHDYFDGHLVPVAAAAAVFGESVTGAAWLHDVVEDTALTCSDLLAAGIAEPVVAAVESVSRRAGETYNDLIERAAADPVGRYVKLVDNGWNITNNPKLAQADPSKAASLLECRYEPARRRLLAACALELDSPQIVQMQQILDAHCQRLNNSTQT